MKFCGAMDMLPPKNVNSYDDHVKAIHTTAKLVANVKVFYDPDDEGICDIDVSSDGAWRRRGYSSTCGVVSGISLITGKVLDVEVMSKECRQCLSWSD